MLEVTVKTLDSQNHSFSVPDEITVKEFKDEIAPVLNIAADKQRLIFCGKILKDDKKLSEYDVNGKVIHVVQSLPPSQGNNSSSNGSSSSSATTNSRNHRDPAGFLLGAFTIPQELVDPAQVQNIVEDVVSGMGEIGRNASVMSRASEDGSVDVHINLGRVPVQVPLQSEAQLRMNRVRHMLNRAEYLLGSIEEMTSANTENVADSSSQTETDEVPELDTANSNASDLPNNSETSNSEESASGGNVRINGQITSERTISGDITSEIHLSEVSGLPSGPERFRFEGLAQAAQAAISAAFATAAAAARAATASVATPVTSTADTSGPLDSEPMDATPSENIPDFLPPINIAPDPTVIAMDSLPSDTESPAQEPAQTENESNSESDSSNHHPNCPLSSTRTPPANEPTSSSRSRAPVLVQPSVQTLANLLDDVVRINTRMQPCLEKCRDLIRNDPSISGRPLVDAHRLFSRVSQLMHFVSHAYHNLSDLHINFSQNPPRSPLVRIISSAHSPSLFQGIPMQAQISISTSSGIVPNPSQSTTTTANNANNDSTRTLTESRPMPTPRINPIITSVSSSTTNRNPLFVQRTQNPVVFMEVSPTSLTIDSISSLVPPPPTSSTPSSDATQTTSATTTTSSTARDTTSQSNETTETRSSSPRSSPPNAAPSSTGQVPPLNIPFRNVIPVPLTSMGSLHTFDSGLPCHSVWALEPSRRRHNAGNARSQPNAQPTVNPNAPGRQEDQLQQAISNIMMSLINHAPAQGIQAPPGVTVFTSRGDDSGSRDGSALFNALREVQEASRQAAMRQNTMGTSNDLNASSPIDSYQDTLRLLNTLGMTNLQVAEILTSIDFRTEGVLGDLVVLLANQFTLKDILDISYGKNVNLRKIRRPLQVYLECNVLLTEEPSDADIDAGVKQISAEILSSLQSFTSATRSRCGMDYPAALSTFIHQSVRKMLIIVLDKKETAAETFQTRIVNGFKDISRDFLALNEKYSFNANSNVEEIAREIIEPLTTTIGRSYQGTITSWTMNTIRRFMQTFSPDNSSESQGSASNSTQGNRTDASQKKADEPKSSSPEPTRPARNNTGVRRRNFVEALGVNEALASGLSGNRSAPTLAAFARIAEQTSALLRNNTQSNDTHPPTRNLREMVLGTDNWHSSVPSNWVPIIARDVQRQRRQATQAPFSDAYLSGMPSKRRKIMSNGGPTLLESSKSALSEMLHQAISSANVKPATNIEELKKDALQNTTLQTSFNKHMKNAIQERLQQDIDYCSERFPNSEKYFN